MALPKRGVTGRRDVALRTSQKFFAIIYMLTLAAQNTHRTIAVSTVATSGLATIPLQKSQGFSLLWHG